MRRYLPFAIILLVGAIALASGTVLFRNKRNELAEMVARAAVDTANGTAGAEPSHLRGEKTASVTIEEFGDFQCPPCEAMFNVLRKLEQDYAAKLRVIFREFPLAMHQHAALAAHVAEAAGMQGHFWEMHDTLYLNRGAWANVADPRSLFIQYGRNLGLDPDRLARDIDDKQVTQRIEDDKKRADSLGVVSTPSLFINGRLIPPSFFSEPGLRRLIDAMLKGEPLPIPIATPTPTVTP